jgi:hypothetical protein
MERFTDKQLQDAERLAIEVGFDDISTPTDALMSLTRCLFCIVQRTETPHYTGRQMGDAGVFILQHYPLSEDFPYSNREIIKDVLKRKSRGR